MNVCEWKRRCIEYLKAGKLSDEEWDYVSGVLLFASESGDGVLCDKFEEAIDPDFDIEPDDKGTLDHAP